MIDVAHIMDDLYDSLAQKHEHSVTWVDTGDNEHGKRIKDEFTIDGLEVTVDYNPFSATRCVISFDSSEDFSETSFLVAHPKYNLHEERRYDGLGYPLQDLEWCCRSVNKQAEIYEALKSQRIMAACDGDSVVVMDDDGLTYHVSLQKEVALIAYGDRKHYNQEPDGMLIGRLRANISCLVKTPVYAIHAS